MVIGNWLGHADSIGRLASGARLQIRARAPENAFVRIARAPTADIVAFTCACFPRARFPLVRKRTRGKCLPFRSAPRRYPGSPDVLSRYSNSFAGRRAASLTKQRIGSSLQCPWQYTSIRVTWDQGAERKASHVRMDRNLFRRF